MRGCFLASVIVTLSVLVGAQNNPVPIIGEPLVPMTVRPGSAAFTLTVNGTGFARGSTVNWNGSPRATAFVNSSQLKAAVEASDISKASSASITVTNPSPGGGNSNILLFSVTVAATSLAVSGGVPLRGSSPNFVTTADLNHDGQADLIVTDQNANVVSIHLGNGNGTFQPRLDYPVGAVPNSVAIGDLNADGIPDLVVSSLWTDQVDILLGDGDGTFRAAVGYDAGIAPDSVVVADFNGDGKLDIAVANYNGGYDVSVLLGNGDGSFQSALHFGTDTYSTGVVAGDFNNDGKLDLAVSVSPASQGFLGVLLGNGDGSFQTAVHYSVGLGAQAIAAADLNSDGNLDVIVSNEAEGDVSVLLGNGDGSFQSATSYDTGAQPYSIAVADFNGDGIPDVATANNSASTVSFLRGHRNGTLQPHIDFVDGGKFSVSLAVADFNGDGKSDIAVANLSAAADGSVSLLFGTAISLTPVSLTFGPQKVGTTSQPQVVTVKNLGETGVRIGKVAIAGAGSGDFAQTSTCLPILVSGASCTLSVTFTPLVAGTRTATILINDTGGGSPQKIPLVGTGN